MKTKRILFYTVIVLIPIVTFTLIEFLLSIYNYYESVETVVIVERNGKKYFTINQSVGERYFNKKKLYYRKGQYDFFEVEKSTNTKRIFCFGASTTAGFPFEYNAIPTEFLRQELSTVLPSKNIEVINTAIAATNSFTVLDLEKELINYKPDLFIVYMGQNEFYGAFGVASSISLGKNSFLIKTNLWLNQFRTYAMLKKLITSIVFNTNEITNPNKTLMEEMILDNSIELNNNNYSIAKESFRKNYIEIIEIAKNNNIPIIISTLVTNNKDLGPFVSLHNKTLSKEQLAKFNALSNLAVKNIVDGNYDTAIDFLTQANLIDSNYAKIHFDLGKCYLALHDSIKAKKEFVLANNLDGLKFRAPSEFNSIILNLSKQYNIPLADVNKTFANKSPKNIIGNELLIDHLHPNIKGYSLLTETWLNTIKNNRFLGLTPKISFSAKDIRAKSTVTELDSMIGKIKIVSLKSRPPFTSKKDNFTFIPNNFIERQVYNLIIDKEISWGLAHFNLAKEYYSKKLFNKAIKELKAILITDNNNTTVNTMLGDAYFNIDNYTSAEKNYLKVYSHKNGFEITKRLAQVELKLKKTSNAIVLFENCLKKYNTISDNNLINEIRFDLALAYFQNQNNIKAKTELRKILSTNPTNLQANNLIRKIKLTQNKNL